MELIIDLRKKGLEGIIEASDLVEKVYLFERGAGLFKFVRLIREIRQEEFDFIFDMQGLLRSAIITTGAKGSGKVGRADGREGSVFFYKSIGEKSKKKRIHAIERLLPFLSASSPISPLILNDPRPLLYPCLIISFPIIIPPVGKSGPGMCFINCATVMSLLLI